MPWVRHVHGKFFGIDTYVHGTFWLLPLFVFVSGAAAGDRSAALVQHARCRETLLRELGLPPT